jgi:hypothetical protein
MYKTTTKQLTILIQVPKLWNFLPENLLQEWIKKNLQNEGIVNVVFACCVLPRNKLGSFSISLCYGGPQLSHYIFSFNQTKFAHIKLKLLTSN